MSTLQDAFLALVDMLQLFLADMLRVRVRVRHKPHVQMCSCEKRHAVVVVSSLVSIRCSLLRTYTDLVYPIVVGD